MKKLFIVVAIMSTSFAANAEHTNITLLTKPSGAFGYSVATGDSELFGVYHSTMLSNEILGDEYDTFITNVGAMYNLNEVVKPFAAIGVGSTSGYVSYDEHGPVDATPRRQGLNFSTGAQFVFDIMQGEVGYNHFSNSIYFGAGFNFNIK